MLAPIFLLDFSIPDSLDFGVRYTPNTFKRGSSLFFTFTFTSPSRRLQRPNHQSPISKISRSNIRQGFPCSISEASNRAGLA
jgi:hypothetical protein